MAYTLLVFSSFSAASSASAVLLFGWPFLCVSFALFPATVFFWGGGGVGVFMY